MDRRRFIATLGGGALAAAPGAVLARESAGTDRQALISTYVTNVGEQPGFGTHPLKAGSQVQLAPRARAYDASTIVVADAEGRTLGYLPTNQGRIVKPLIEAGLPMSAVVTEVRSLPRPSIGIDISIDRHHASA